MFVNKTAVEDPVSNLTRQIGDTFSGLYNQMRTRAKPEMAESFDVWLFDIKNLPKAIEMRELVVSKSEFQHHQIRLGKRARAYALSKPSASGERRVSEAALSKVAERMDRAMERLDNDDKDNKLEIEARLVVIPACWVYFFWLVDRDQIYFFSALHRFRQLRRPRYFKTDQFLSLLNDVLEPFQPLAEQANMRW